MTSPEKVSSWSTNPPSFKRYLPQIPKSEFGFCELMLEGQSVRIRQCNYCKLARVQLLFCTGLSSCLWAVYQQQQRANLTNEIFYIPVVVSMMNAACSQAAVNQDFMHERVYKCAYTIMLRMAVFTILLCTQIIII